MKYTVELDIQQRSSLENLLALMGVELKPIKTTNVEDTNEYQIGYKVGFEDGTERNLQGYYNKGLEDAWELIKAIDTNREFAEEVFGEDLEEYDFDDVSIKDAMKKWKAYEEKKKAEEEIKVGDEIVCNCPNEQRVIITAICDGWATFMRKDGACYSRADKDLKKTGRHFDEVEQLLDKLRGEKDEKN